MGGTDCGGWSRYAISPSRRDSGWLKRSDWSMFSTMSSMFLVAVMIRGETDEGG